MNKRRQTRRSSAVERWLKANERCSSTTYVLLGLLLSWLMCQVAGSAETDFVRPRPGDREALAVWGHLHGLKIGIDPTPGPAGLIRIYTPYLQQPYPRVVNFVSVEPSVAGRTRRGQSELEMSRRSGSRGIVFWASNEPVCTEPPEQLAPGVIDESGNTLRLFIHMEPFENGAHPIIECRFDKARPHEVEFRTHATDDSAEITYCTLSATMGNFGLLRQIHLRDQRVVTASQLWQQEPLDGLGFLPWRHWLATELAHTDDGHFFVQLSTDTANPSAAKHDPKVAPHWRYVGEKARHYWRAESDAQPVAAVNGRKTYWMSQSEIPGGIAFENFELRIPFQAGRPLWFGVQPDETDP